jgi:hypothetical protein
MGRGSYDTTGVVKPTKCIHDSAASWEGATDALSKFVSLDTSTNGQSVREQECPALLPSIPAHKPRRKKRSRRKADQRAGRNNTIGDIDTGNSALTSRSHEVSIVETFGGAAQSTKDGGDTSATKNSDISTRATRPISCSRPIGTHKRRGA